MPRPLRLVFVGTLTEPGGAAAHFISLTTAMAAAGHQIAAVADPTGHIWRALEGVPGITLHAASFDHPLSWSAMRTVSRAARTIAADHILCGFERDYRGTALAAAACRVPLVLFLHHAKLKRGNRRLLRVFPRRFFLPSYDLQRWLVALGLPAAGTEVSRNPVDTDQFRPDAERRAAERAALGIAEGDVLIGYIGRLESDKGIVPFAQSVTKAMDRAPQLRALWVGFGALEPALDGIISASPYACRHLRRPWTEDVRAHYAALDLIALPSTGRESFGRVLIEAQAHAVAVLGSRIGGIGETMEPGRTGLLVAPGDVDAWAEAIVDLATDATRRGEMGSAGRAFVQSYFDSAVVAAELARQLRTGARR